MTWNSKLDGIFSNGMTRREYALLIMYDGYLGVALQHINRELVHSSTTGIPDDLAYWSPTTDGEGIESSETPINR